MLKVLLHINFFEMNEVRTKQSYKRKEINKHKEERKKYRLIVVFTYSEVYWNVYKGINLKKLN